MATRKKTSNGMMMVGSIRSAGVTSYMKQGKLVVRSSHSEEKRSNTLGQFMQRQRMRHSVALWKRLRPCVPLFTERSTAYLNFISLANRLPVVYVNGRTMDDATFLMPGLPVSDGKLPAVMQQLGEVEGRGALLTNLKARDLKHGEELRLYTAEQRIERDVPTVSFSVRKVALDEMTEVDGCLALVDEVFADDRKGWALVRADVSTLRDKWRCSPQGIVTRCTLYQQYTTDEALQTAAKSYGGITAK